MTQQTTTALAIPTDRKGMLARVDAAAKRGLFPADLSAEMRVQLTDAALMYGLDPLFEELILFQGKPFIPINGRRRKDAEAGNILSFHMRLLTPEERQFYLDAEAIDEGDLAAIYVGTDVKNGATIEVIARVLASEKGSPHLPINKWRAEMLEKRGERKLREKLFGPIAKPRALDPAIAVVVEGEAREIGNEAPETAVAPPIDPPKPSSPPKPQREQETPSSALPSEVKSLAVLLELSEPEGWTKERIAQELLNGMDVGEWLEHRQLTRQRGEAEPVEQLWRLVRPMLGGE